ncbi:MAG: GAF domain-containing protein [Bdellovibrio sp.]|nr:GAF domain-containing protein [Bdellovibrio sp.]
MSIKLAQLDCCFEGVIPSTIATCSQDGTPNASYLSHVYRVDEKHVATSFQFFNRTRANLMENPYAAIRVRHPVNLQSYRLRTKYVRSEDQGPVFDQMSVKMDVIAAYEGMGSIFKLKAVDIYEVLEIEQEEGETDYHPPMTDCPSESREDLELLRVISDKMNQVMSLEELFDQSMQLLNRYLGWTHMILLLADEDEKLLVTHASFGYAVGGVGAEVKWGEGLIGLCAEHRRLLQVNAMAEVFRYAKAVKLGVSSEALTPRIPLPGLTNPASQVAAPIKAHGEFIGVLAVESETKRNWGPRDQLFLSTITNMLGVGISALEAKGRAMKVASQQDSHTLKEQNPILRVRYVPGDDFIFVNDQYLIKNIPARILWYLLQTFSKSGRSEFSNMELRAEKSLNLPEIKDNLETRLILLRKRLEEQASAIRLVSSGRGKFRLEVSGRLDFSSGE